ncbi:MAG: RNA polymerase sigma factor [Acidimicrobiales bacterium]
MAVAAIRASNARAFGLRPAWRSEAATRPKALAAGATNSSGSKAAHASWRRIWRAASAELFGEAVLALLGGAQGLALHRDPVSHLSPWRCCREVALIRSADAGASSVLAIPAPGADGVRGRREMVALSGSSRDAMRTDLDEIFRRHYPLVVGVAARVLGSRDQAEDVAQDALVSFGRTSVPASEARGWLCVAAAHGALNQLRSGRRRARREATGGAAGAGVVGDVADEVVALEERRRVREALARLPRKQAVALVLRHNGLSYAEVAAALDLSVGSVGTTVRRAESALRKDLIRHESSH